MFYFKTLVTISVLKLLLFSVSIVTFFFFGLLFLWYILFYPFTLNLLVPWKIKHASCRCYVTGLLKNKQKKKNYPANHCLWFGVLCTLTINIITNKVGLNLLNKMEAFYYLFSVYYILSLLFLFLIYTFPLC